MQNPKVSILLPALNAEETVQDAIVSILRQSYEDWELLIMDDGSIDRTAGIAAQFPDTRIRVLSDGVHRGRSAQLNLAMKIARGKYVARMDADDIAYPDRLQKQLEFLECHPNVNLVGTAVMLFRSGGRIAGVRRYPANHEEICARPWLRMPVIHASWMGQIEWFRRHPYRVDATRVEDYDLLRRTHPESRFANIREVLLGVREDSISLHQQMIARKEICKYAIESSRRDRDFPAAGRTLAAQLPRAALDILAVGSGLGLALLPRGARPATRAEIEEWNAVWKAMRSVYIANHLPESSPSSGC